LSTFHGENSIEENYEAGTRLLYAAIRVSDKLKLKFIGISLHRAKICGNNESIGEIYEDIRKLRDFILADY
jgi:hypothetical protein